MKLNKDEQILILAMIKTIDELPIGFDAIHISEMDNDKIFDITSKLKKKLELVEDEIQQELSFNDVIDYLKTKESRGANIACYDKTYGILTCYLYLDNRDLIKIGGDSDLDIYVDELEFLNFID